MIIFVLLGVVLTTELETTARPRDRTHIVGRTVVESDNKQYHLDQELETVCDCIATTPEIHLAEELCDPTKIKLHLDKPGQGNGGATFEEIRTMIGPLSDLVFVDPTNYHFSCLDGRIKNPVLGSPGLTPSRKLTQEVVDSIFTTYLTYMKQPKFYMCTDDDALDHIEKELGISISLDGLKNPIDQVKIDLLRVLMKPENTGCFHIKNLLKFPENYNVRIEIVHMFLKILYRTLWDKNNLLSEKIILDGLVGQKEEKAFLEVRSNEACKKTNSAPLIHPRIKVSLAAQSVSDKEIHYADPVQQGDWLSIFVNHIDAVSTKRRETAKFFAQQVNHNGEHIDVDQMHHRLNKHGLTYLELTGSKIAKYLPFFTVNLV